MSATRKGTGASAEDCGCESKASNRAADPKREGWGRVLNSLWPSGMPFPPAAPWAGAVLKRSNLAKVIQEMPDKLPTLPVTAVGSEGHIDNLVAIADFLSLEAPPRDAPVLRSCGCLDKECDEQKSDAECECWDGDPKASDDAKNLCIGFGGRETATHWYQYEENRCALYTMCGDPYEMVDGEEVYRPAKDGQEATNIILGPCEE